MFTVYVLYSTLHDRIYIGYSSNLIQRFYSHNELGKTGSTIKHRPWIVIYCEYYDNKTDAMKREKQLKSGQGRAWIREKINTQFHIYGYIFP